MLSKFFSYYFIFIFIFCIIICCLFIPFVLSSPNISTSSNNTFYDSFNISSSQFIWAVPGYTRITSKFGKRISPTKGSSSNHSGIDIAAPTGSKIVAIFSGKVTYTGFKGAGGFTITIQNSNFTVSYCHVSPQFVVSVGNSVLQGDFIGNVGPLNVYGIINNPYRDKDGRPTNGATTGPHLHLTIKKDGIAVNPLDFY